LDIDAYSRRPRDGIQITRRKTTWQTQRFQDRSFQKMAL